jgi:hypothetical protein
MTLGEWSLGEWSLGEWSLGEWSLGEPSLGEPTLSRRFSVGRYIGKGLCFYVCMQVIWLF